MGTNCNAPGPCEQQQQQTSATTCDGLLSFAEFRAKKEEDRAKFFKPRGPSAKKFKTGSEKTGKDVIIDIGSQPRIAV